MQFDTYACTGNYNSDFHISKFYLRDCPLMFNPDWIKEFPRGHMARIPFYRDGIGLIKRRKWPWRRTSENGFEELEANFKGMALKTSEFLLEFISFLFYFGNKSELLIEI
ncbi:hypothetical protein C1645_740107 [Glomus cerebriforme]|uniref:Uncharacterized protein n=1 Tax=Glomus cerebriforme TaxID=658196 RepID=A0A397SS83_9GLOM|nr:hypothetical protein C1645_740107 [Glomus cerebriforme]